MSQYEQQLTALGLPPDVIRLHVLDNDIGIFRNREHEAYGRQDSDEERSND